MIKTELKHFHIGQIGVNLYYFMNLQVKFCVSKRRTGSFVLKDSSCKEMRWRLPSLKHSGECSTL